MHTKTAQNKYPSECNTCGESGKVHSLVGNGHGKYYYRPRCNSCKAKADNKARNLWKARKKAEDPDGWYRIRRNEQLKKCYKITLEEYETILEKQNGVCAICKGSEGERAMPLDHNHSTLTNRGILCHWCNKGLGQFFDNPTLLREAADYIDRWNK